MTDIKFRTVRSDLYNRYGHICDSQIIDDIVDTVVDEHTATAKVTNFLSVLVAREAAERIEDHIWTHGDVGDRRKRILFVSRGNAAWASLAAGLARQLSGNAVVATVAGTHPENREDTLVEWVMDERGLDTSAQLDFGRQRTLDAADIVVYLGIDETPDLAGRRYVQWDISAADGMDLSQARVTADDLADHVSILLSELGVPVQTRSPLPA
ncbi:three-helix bundle dimerization domain-containing protein [Corynebacterium alimapuense]|uniref:Phosphotyrosine protein phosphatase I domain-containing protein n=1 Tax=Corynebacterium alimapuense TaxID=1576874 RepID=A0A3M8KA16_9CORY|nr:hypothetical protein [Corynebacterium alimapuense]RNE49996.1 hypothetical protein C5L39_01080 [Corynebacterium alimapuense]